MSIHEKMRSGRIEILLALLIFLVRVTCSRSSDEQLLRVVRISPNYLYDQITGDYIHEDIYVPVPPYDPIAEKLNISIPATFSQNSSDIPTSEFNALHALYNATNGARWRYDEHMQRMHTHWNFSGQHNPCVEQWEGLTCACLPLLNGSAISNHSCTIDRIVLNYFNLQGSIPNSIGALPNLTWLQLSVNSLTGSIPPTLVNLTKLRLLDLSFNNLTSTLPAFIGSFRDLEYLVLNSNGFNGTISPSYCSFPHMVQFTLSVNRLTGPLPACITQLMSLTLLDVYSNALTGTLPDSFQNMTRLRLLNAFSNYFTGPLPETLAEVTSLVQLNVFNNSLNGTIPVAYSRLLALHSLNVFDNRLTGKIPPQLAELKHSLLVLNLFDNLLTGTIPPQLGELTHLLRLDVCTNHLSSALPPSFGNLTDLFELYINNNVVYSTIPESWTQMSSLYVLYLQANFLTGTLPEGFGTQLRSLTEFDLSGNRFTGSIPESFGNLVHLTEFSLYDNLLSGTVPVGLLSACTEIGILYLSNNLFSGTIPASIGNLNKTNYLYLDQNMFSGTLPSSILNMSLLSILFVEQNSFSGNINAFLDSARTPLLQHLDLSHNSFTGTLSADLFAIRSLVSVATVTNCITGSLPDAICDAPYLSVLALDGLNTAPACQIKIFPAIQKSSAYTLSAYITGGVPTCLFNMPSLQTLHLSGNGLSGSFPDDLIVSATLTDLSLSHNRLSGTIPLALQTHAWSNLDLSYNTYSGTLSSSFHSVASDGALSLQDNHLSGKIPSSLKAARNISILQGSLFACDYSRDQLPANDQWASVYQCGSDDFNQSVLFYGIILFFLVLVRLCVYYSMTHYKPPPASVDKAQAASRKVCFGRLFHWTRQLVRKIVLWSRVLADEHINHNNNGNNSDESGEGRDSDLDLVNGRRNSSEAKLKIDSNSDLVLFSHILHAVRSSTAVILAVILFAFLPIYGVLSTSFSTYTYEYAWQLSAAFLAGKKPAIVLFVAFTLFMVCLFNVFDKTLYYGRLTTDARGAIVRHSMTKSSFSENKEQRRASKAAEGGEPTNRTARADSAAEAEGMSNRNSSAGDEEQPHKVHYTMCTLITIINMLVVFPANIAYVYIAINYASSIVTLAQIAVAIFKLTWSDIAVRGMIRVGSAWVNRSTEDEAPPTTTGGVSVDGADGRSRTSSFPQNGSSGGLARQTLTPAEIGGSTHSVHAIASHARQVQYESKYILFQIVLSLINNIAVPFLATTAISSDCFYTLFVTPPLVNAAYTVTQCALYYLQLDGAVHCVKMVDLVHDTTYVPPFLYSYQCSSAFVTNYGALYVYMFAFILFFGPAFTLLAKECAKHAAEGSKLRTYLHAVLPPILKPLPDEFPTTIPVLFDRDGFIVRISRNMAILVTFGVIFPPLAVVICSAIVSYTFYEQCKVGRFLLLVHATQRQHFAAYKKLLEAQCHNLSKPLDHLFWLLAPFAILFYAYFLFDINASEAGVLPSLWMLIVICCMPLIIYALFRLFRYYHPITAEGDSSALVSVYNRVLAMRSSALTGGIEMSKSVDRRGVGGVKVGVKGADSSTEAAGVRVENPIKGGHASSKNGVKTVDVIEV